MGFKQKKSKYSTTIIPIPIVNQQHSYDCGPAALNSIAKFFGVEKEQDDLIKMCRAGKIKGTHPEDLVNCAEQLGLQSLLIPNMKLNELLRHIAKKRPVICAIQAWGDKKQYHKLKNGHYVVAMGFDPEKEIIYFQDPSMDAGFRGHLSFDEFLNRWHDEEVYPKREIHHMGVVVWSNLITLNTKEIP